MPSYQKCNKKSNLTIGSSGTGSHGRRFE